MTVSILQGDCLEVLKTLPDESVQCVVTSPPFYGLRDYGTANWEGGDPDCTHIKGDEKARSRNTPSIGYAESQGHNLESWGKVCGKCGAIRIDDQIGLETTPEEYVGRLIIVFREVRRVLRPDGTLWLNLGDSYNGSGGEHNDGGGQSGIGVKDRGRVGVGIGKKNVVGLKPKDLIGIPWMVAFALRADGWYLRSDIIWNKPNPMPESVTDRPTKSHEYIFLLSKSRKYYYDADAIMEQSTEWEISSDWRKQRVEASGGVLSGGVGDGTGVHNTRNKRDVWTVTTKPYKGAHFATFPPDLIEPCILAGSKPGDTIMDIFNGSGTTGETSIKYNRSYIGIELNPKYIDLTNERLSEIQPVLALL